MAKQITEFDLGEGTPLAADILAQIPIFEGIALPTLKKYQGAVVMRKFRKGEVICREGEFGSTAFYLLQGTVHVAIKTPMAHVKTGGGVAGFVRKISSALVGQKDDPRPDTLSRPIPIDAPVNLDTDRPVAVLVEGSLFGEMTCLSHYPRSATVTAAEDCELLEMLANVLQLLKKSKHFKERLEGDYKSRAMDAHLRSVPLLAGLTDDFMEHLRHCVSLQSFAPGDTICTEGDPADAFFLIRIGFVKVSRQFPGGDMVLAYLSRGNAFGEMGLLGEGVREATCTALDHVELVRIDSGDFKVMMANFPEIKDRLEMIAAERRRANKAVAESMSAARLDKYLEQGLMEAQNLLVIDLNKCTRCDDCVRSCADTHDGVTRLIRDGLRFDKYLVATSCRQCRDPLCMIGCPVGSIRRKETLEIIIEDWCIGCSLCAKNCPYGNINMHHFPLGPEELAEARDSLPEAKKASVKDTRDKATTCDLCSHLNEPSCVTACPHDAAMRIDPRRFFIERIGKRA